MTRDKNVEPGAGGATQACERCGHDLSALLTTPWVRTCPECGKPFVTNPTYDPPTPPTHTTPPTRSPHTHHTHTPNTPP